MEKTEKWILLFLDSRPTKTTFWATLCHNSITFLTHTFRKKIYTIYVIVKGEFVIIEFISFISASYISWKNLASLLRPEDRKLNQILVKHLKEARTKNQKAYTRNLKMYVNKIPYTIEKLPNPTNVNICIEQDSAIHSKNGSGQCNN